jgi:hypothetical protein
MVPRKGRYLYIEYIVVEGSWVLDSGPTFLSLSYSLYYCTSLTLVPYYIPPTYLRIPTLVLYG